MAHCLGDGPGGQAGRSDRRGTNERLEGNGVGFVEEVERVLPSRIGEDRLGGAASRPVIPPGGQDVTDTPKETVVPRLVSGRSCEV